MITIILLGEPKSTQHCYKISCRGKFATMYMSAEAKTIKTDYQWQCKSQYRKVPSIEELEIEVRLFFGTKRQSDIDNFSKLLFDSLTGLIWVDDSQIQKAIFSKNYCKEKPRIEIDIKKYDRSKERIQLERNQRPKIDTLGASL